MPAPNSDPEMRKRRRERIYIFALSFAIILLTGVEYKLTRISSSLPFVNSIFFFGLINFNIIILVALLWLIFKNVGKLFFERKSRLLGARLKTKLVTAFIGFSIIPTLTLFMISVLYINQSFDKWFSLKIQNTLQSSLEISALYYNKADQSSNHFASLIERQIRASLHSKKRKISPNQWKPSLQNFRSMYDLNAVELYLDPLEPPVLALDPVSLDQNSQAFVRLSLDRLKDAFRGTKSSFIQNVGYADLVRTVYPSIDFTSGKVKGIVVVTVFIPANLTARAGQIANVAQDYKETNPLRYPIKTTYLIMLILITLLIIFAEIWLGLYLAREISVPIERLVRAAQEVGQGRLDVSIEKSGDDEIGALVDSFNRMTADLRANQSTIRQRTQQLEAILANIATGVILIDQGGRILSLNSAAINLLDLPNAEYILRPLRSLFEREENRILEQILNAGLQDLPRASREISWTTRIKGETRNLTAIASPLKEAGSTWGAVAVIDDLTFFVKGQREMAWREVAKRIAHEIKNPLTPIKLSAQRLQRRLKELPGKDGQLVQECTHIIIEHTDELKEMVNEFSNFARFPEVSLTPNQLNDLLQETLQLYSSAHPDLHFIVHLDPKLPIIDFDKEQIRRVILNLLDNAIAAINTTHKIPKRIEVETHFNPTLEVVALIVRDNGPGMSSEVQDRAFEPYFSTKKEGTGLGLAIVKRIVSDHGGYIRLVSTPDEGSTFTVELPRKYS